jgi:protein-tyrosine phosphatase
MRTDVITTEVDSQHRHVTLDGCFNFRDLGGYAGADGRHVKWRRLFRADGPHALTLQDRDALGALGLRSVIDLRAPTEGHASYLDVVSGAQCHALPLLDLVPDDADIEKWVDPNYVARRYREMFETGSEVIIEVIATLTDPAAAPAVVHCSAGKDRTGIVSGVLLALLGVDDDTIVADYALSARAMRRFTTWLFAHDPNGHDRIRRALPALVAAEPAAMHDFLTGLRADYGSIVGWAEQHDIGSAVGFLRASFLEPA